MISVVITTHNRKKDLLNAIRSIALQYTLPAELIVIDDGSEIPIDWSIFKIMPKTVSCFLKRIDFAKGPSFARNLGVKLANQPWVAFLDDDDEFFLNKIQVVKRFIAENSDVDLFFHAAQINMVKERISYNTDSEGFKSKNSVLRELLAGNVVGGTPLVVLKRSSFKFLGGFDESLGALEDYELWIRFAKNGFKFFFVNKVLTKCNYLTKRRSISKSIKENKKALERINAKYAEDYHILTQNEVETREKWLNRMIIHKYILNRRVLKAFQQQYFYFFRSFKPFDFLQAVLLLTGPKFLFFLRRLLGIFRSITRRSC